MTLLSELAEGRFLKVVASNPFNKSGFVKITIRPLSDGSKRSGFQAEKLTATQAFHDNISLEQLEEWASNNVLGKFKQVCLFYDEKTVTYLFSKNNSKRLESKVCNKPVDESHNRSKNYILNEGDAIPAFVDLGIFTKDYKVVQAKQDKFRQINRFVEIIDDAFRDYDKQEVTILDFGCGKSYLTFFIYYYFVKIKKLKTKIIGYDLKTEVVKNCNGIAQKYGYENLHFVVADVSKDKLCDEHIDMVVSLHACDTATDYALNYAVKKGVKYIFSVPCCQHEVNLSIQNGGDFDLLLKYGIIKERFSALLTDAVRAKLLEDEGYSVDLLEFVDMTHSPKNLMIRAKKTHGKSNKNREQIKLLMEKYGFGQTLFGLLDD